MAEPPPLWLYTKIGGVMPPQLPVVEQSPSKVGQPKLAPLAERTTFSQVFSPTSPIITAPVCVSTLILQGLRKPEDQMAGWAPGRLTKGLSFGMLPSKFILTNFPSNDDKSCATAPSPLLPKLA